MALSKPMVLAAAAAMLLIAGCANQPADAPASTTSQEPVPHTTIQQPASASPSVEVSESSSPAEGATVSCAYEAAGQPAKPVDPPPSEDVPASGTVTATLNMTEGPVTITLDRAAAPCTVNSFIGLAKQGYYDNTSCHRLVDQGIYVLQCGDPTGEGTGGPGYRFADELTGTETYGPGVVAMANAGPNTNGSQFFLVWADSPLDPDYTVFGSLDQASLDVVTSIAGKGISRENAPNPISPAKIEGVVLG